MRSWRRFDSTFRVRIWDGKSSTSETSCTGSLQELERRERHLAKRERELNLLRERVARHAAAKHFIAGSAAMQDVLELAARVAPLDTTVLVYGESGTGQRVHRPPDSRPEPARQRARSCRSTAPR